jgi:uncharacterized protein YkwD
VQPSRRFRTLIALVPVGVLALLPGAAHADPQVLRVTLSKPPIVGRALDMRVRAVDPDAAVTGSVTTFGDGHSFGTSACRPADSAGHAPGGPFAAGTPVTIQSPQQFSKAGQLAGLLRLDSGGCTGLTGSVLQPFTLAPAQPGGTPGGLVLGTPVPVDVNPAPGTPAPPPVPGSGLLPPLPPLPIPIPPIGGGGGGGGGGPPLPPVPPLPPLPTPPIPPILPLASAASASASASRCAGANRKVGRTRKSRRRARKAMLCLLNVQRRRHGLRPLHGQRRLFEASFRHSRAMVRRNFFAHVEPGGIGLVTRLVRVRYLPKSGWTVGENIAWGTGPMSTPRSIVRAWMHSTGHRANILNPRFREIGLGIHRGVPAPTRISGATVTTDFGDRH